MERATGIGLPFAQLVVRARQAARLGGLLATSDCRLIGEARGRVGAFGLGRRLIVFVLALAR